MNIKAIKQAFDSEGYYMLESFIDKGHCEHICRELDKRALNDPGGKNLIPDQFFDRFVTDERILNIVEVVLGKDFLFHHANGRVLNSPLSGKAWHHDYDGERPWYPDDPIMVHTMIYPHGLSCDNGPLLVLPQSQKQPVERSFPNDNGTERLKGDVCVTCLPGTLIILNSAVWHARLQPKLPPRYDLNISYCQPGIRRPEREHWRDRIEHLLSVSAPTLSHLFQDPNR